MDTMEEQVSRDDESISVRPEDVRRAAMNLLARREHSRFELCEKLRKRFGGEDALISAELDRLADEGLQSDWRMAEAFVRSRIRRGQGPVRIRMELAGRGVTPERVDAALAEAATDWTVLAREVAARKYTDLDAVSNDLRLKGKLSRFLQQRGFTFDHIGPLIHR